ncbi:PQQ-binding-like beta-propeller repeat protein [Nocardioides sp. SYSU D00038]|uniref:PQQ-binding-like beta-propeller repeat protein n=1 Tax=Nocardioides sp. SYSU D00038 TaxID=2812554 RepID=UPI001966D948|nr:PQQ-binding-like beta-propeller repeat protein [Nocardioides sp. SYSU D00038]
MTRSRRSGPALGAPLVLVGLALVAATTGWDWGRIPYAGGAALAAVGLVWLVATSVRPVLWRVLLGVAALSAGVVVAVLAVVGLPSDRPTWDDADAGALDDRSATTGGLVVTGGTARDVETGEEAWSHGGPDAEPLLVTADLVVLGTADGSLAVDPGSGRELWSAPVAGRGIAHDDVTLVVASTPSGGATEAVGLSLATGEVEWRRRGRPVMECDLGPADRFTPAREQAHVLVVPDEERSGRAGLLRVSDGAVTAADVDCLVAARVVGDVLVEVTGRDVRLVGRSAGDGRRLWAVPVAEPSGLLGGGPTLVAAGGGDDVTTIDTTTGRLSKVPLPTGVQRVLATTEVLRSDRVWLLVDRGDRAAVWDPISGKVADVPDAVTATVADADVGSGWLALSGTTRDLTGAESDRCWAVSPEGWVSDPVPGSDCRVAGGLLVADDEVHPVGE